MTLDPGTRLGPYEILSPIGAGGMGEVYKGKDTRLDRIVAIKVLPEHLAKDSERRERFEREARAVSSLNHPNICTLHDIGEQDGTDFLVMEYIEGETLADRLKKGALPLDQALRHGIEIADALDKAHRQGVVHRDLKPGNIMLTKGGTKLLDFGLAKLKAQEPGQAAPVLSALPTEQKPLTEKGSIVGTFQYMAPEQLEGKDADSRTDIFAFGAVLYEMLTGKKAFEGKSQASLITAIMSGEPRAISTLKPMTPPALERTVRKCLAKEPENRWQSAKDLHDELKWIAEGGEPEGLPIRAGADRRISGRLAMGIALGTLFIGALLASLVMWSLKSGPSQRPLMRFGITLPPTERLTSTGRHAVALSPDGTHLVYVANDQLYLRPMDQMEATPIRGTGGALGERSRSPFFSPDGQWVGFYSEGKLKKVSVNGGAPVTLCDAEIPWGAAWGPNDTIVFGQGAKGIMQLSADGGTPEVLVTMDSTKHEMGYRPQILPGGTEVLFTVRSLGTPWDDAQTFVQSLSTGERQVLLSGGADARYVPTGHLVYAREGRLMAVPFDLERLEVSGGPVPIAEGIMQSASSGAAQFSFSRVGGLVYVPSVGQEALRMLVWVSRDGREVEPIVEEPLHLPRYLRISPDGQRLATSTGPRGTPDLWVYHQAGQPPTPLTFEGANSVPVWKPDGTGVAFSSTRAGSYDLYWIPADGSTLDPELLLTSPNQQEQRSRSWSPDGSELIFDRNNPDSGWDIFALPIEGKREPRVVVGTEYDELLGMLSSDGRWLAYQSNVTGSPEIWVRPYPLAGAPIRISPNGGVEPVWGPEDREIFYLEGDKMMAVAIKTYPEFRFESAMVLFEEPYDHDTRPSYDVAPDGRFVMIQRSQEGLPTRIQVVLNWAEELNRLTPVN